MNSVELQSAHRGAVHHGYLGLRALEAQRMIDWFTLRLGPSAAAGLIAYLHMGELGPGLIVFACVLVATQAIERSQLPLHLMPASRVLLGLAAPVAGAAAAWLIALAAGSSHAVSEYEAVVLGAWLVTALGAWIKARLEEGLEARIAVVGPREFAADFVAELDAAGVRTYDVVGWISPEGPAEYRRMRWLGTLEDVREAVIAERIDLIVCAPGRRGRRGRSGGEHLRAGRRRLPRPAGAPDRRQPALRGDLRPRPGRDDRRRLVPLHHASALPRRGPVLEAGLRPRRRDDHGDRSSCRS